MSNLFIGARHLHIPVLSMLPVLHGFLLLEDETGQSTTFSGDRELGGGWQARLVVYERRYTAEEPDAQDVVVVRVARSGVDARFVRSSFRATLARITALDLTYNLFSRNCNTVITTLLLQADFELPPPPAWILPGYGKALL
jgi:hypothetical protein